jgi:hypothetical protein
MKTQRTILAFAAALMFGAGHTAQAVPFGSFFDVFVDLDLNGLPTITQPIPITPGSSFTVQLRLDTDAVPTIGFDYDLNLAEPGGSGFFRLSNRDNVGPFTDVVTTDPILYAGTNPLLDPATVNLGGLIANIGTPLPDGEYKVANVTIDVLPGLAPGLYTISSLAGITDDNFNTVPVTVNAFQLQVIPEPGVTALGLVGAGLIAGQRRRARK